MHSNILIIQKEKIKINILKEQNTSIFSKNKIINSKIKTNFFLNQMFVRSKIAKY